MNLDFSKDSFDCDKVAVILPREYGSNTPVVTALMPFSVTGDVFGVNKVMAEIEW